MRDCITDGIEIIQKDNNKALNETTISRYTKFQFNKSTNQ